MELNIENFDNLIIYQFGKVGSSTLTKTFENIIPTTHTHYFDSNLIKNKTLIINVTRNLFDRNISAFFQNINNKPNDGDFDIPYNGKHIREGCLMYSEKKEMSELINFFRDINIEKLLKIRYTNWYKYFNEQLNINIFEKPFDFYKKYTIYETNNITLIILRFEDINNWENILSTIFNRKINIISDNLTNNKDIYELYENFKKTYKYSEEEINLIKNIDFMKHFYLDIEIDKFIKRFD
uniref:Sulfotransferase domain-containing protein n=1 Tax=viral metagenome TaxID=1070528 RepID=A0A6C0EF78_9ZZZZ